MASNDGSRPGNSQSAARAERLAAELRENLKRRKSRARALTARRPDEPEAAVGDAGQIDQDAGALK